MSYYKLTLFIACLCLLCGGSQAQTKVATAMADFVTPRMRIIRSDKSLIKGINLFNAWHKS